MCGCLAIIAQWQSMPRELKQGVVNLILYCMAFHFPVFWPLNPNNLSSLKHSMILTHTIFALLLSLSCLLEVA